MPGPEREKRPTGSGALPDLSPSERLPPSSLAASLPLAGGGSSPFPPFLSLPEPVELGRSMEADLLEEEFLEEGLLEASTALAAVSSFFFPSIKEAPFTDAGRVAPLSKEDVWEFASTKSQRKRNRLLSASNLPSEQV